ncbi:MAG TPA: type II toxin-antitoxin system PemK/MazF family toxin [Tepidisphaeraceae bacterium]|jgi:mRNA interferase MazF
MPPSATASVAPRRGEVWRVDFEPVRGHEQGRTRPALVISNSILNQSPAGMVTVVPITTRERKLRSYLRLNPRDGGLPQTSFVICDQIRTIAKERLGRRYGVLPRAAQAEVEERLKFLLDLA